MEVVFLENNINIYALKPCKALNTSKKKFPWIIKYVAYLLKGGKESMSRLSEHMQWWRNCVRKKYLFKALGTVVLHDGAMVASLTHSTWNSEKHILTKFLKVKQQMPSTILLLEVVSLLIEIYGHGKGLLSTCLRFKKIP